MLERLGAGIDNVGGYLVQHPRLQKTLAAFCVGGAVGIGVAAEQSAMRHTEHSIAQLQNQNNEQQRHIERLTELAEGSTGLSRDAVLGTYLRDPHKLPGYGRGVAGSDETALQQAAVKIYKRKPGDRRWQENCSGTLISVTGQTQPLVLSARHCFSRDVPALKGGNSAAEAANITAFDPYTYAIVPSGHNANTYPAAISTEVSISMTDKDAAVMSFNDPTGILDAEANALDFKAHISHIPKVGESVVAFSMPTAANGKVLRGEGVYLGTTFSSSMGEVEDIIGLTHADTPATDACNFGASGSSAVFASGYVSGPLSDRANLQYAQGAPDNPADPKQVEIKNRLELEQQLGVDTSIYNTLCGYAALEGQNVSVDRLVDGFSHPLIVSTPAGKK